MHFGFMVAIVLYNIHQHFSAIHISIFRLMRLTIRIKLKYVWVTARYGLVNQKSCTFKLWDDLYMF
jgi:hypothetical protein